MPAVLHSVLTFVARSWRRLSSGLCLFYARGREALLRRAEARTELQELAIEEKRQQLAKQRANDIIDIMLKVEKIKDPQLREKAKTAILAGDHTLLPHDDAVA
jgi:hypothetical protein